MAIQAISFGQNDQVQKKSAMPAAAAATVVLTGAGAAGGYFGTKLNEDSFVRAAVADQEKSAQKEIKKAEKELDGFLKKVDGTAKETYEAGLKDLSNDVKARENLRAAEENFKKAEADLKKLSDKDGNKLADVAEDKFNKAKKAVDEAKNQKDTAFTAYEKAVPADKRYSNEQLEQRAKDLKKTALESLQGDDKKAVEAAQKVITEKTPLMNEAKTAAEELKTTKDLSKSENALVNKFKSWFTVKEGEKRADEAEKLVSKLTKAAKKSKAMLYGGIGLAVGAAAMLVTHFTGSKKA